MARSIKDPETDRLARALALADATGESIAEAIRRAIGARERRDSFSYALTMSKGEPLLFVGDDVSHADVSPVVW